MKNFLPLFFLFLVLFHAAGCRSLPTLKNARGKTPREVMQSLADSYLEKTKNSGIVVAAILPNGTNVMVHAGIADPARPEMPLNGKTLFELASLTKDIVTLAVLGAAKDGRVDLDAPVTTYTEYPLPAVYATVTLRDLLNHRSGLSREALGMGDLRAILSCWLFGGDIYISTSQREGLFKTLSTKSCADMVKGKGSHYSNLGFGLLGVLVENATRDSIPNLVAQYVTGPLQMKDTTFSPDPEQRKRLAAALAGDIPVLTRRGHPTPEHTLGDGLRSTGGIYSTADDMLRFLRFYKKLILSQTDISSIPFQDDGKIRFNHALRISPEYHRLFCRWGMYYGYATFAGMDLENGVVVLLLRNNTDWADNLGLTFLRALSAVCIPEK